MDKYKKIEMIKDLRKIADFYGVHVYLISNKRNENKLCAVFKFEESLDVLSTGQSCEIVGKSDR